MSFHFAPSESSDSDSDLPFPAPLPRNAFSPDNPHFSPHEFLASLRNRHQTLEDLRSELRARSRDLERELVELVNRNYADFVGLGTSVKGGETRVEDLKVGLMGFRREVESVVGKIEGTKKQVERELWEMDKVRGKKRLLRKLFALDERVEDLSAMLFLDGPGEKSAAQVELGFWDEEEGLTGVNRLRSLVTSWLYVQRVLLAKIPKEHPFVKAQEGKLKQIRETMVLDLCGALKEARSQGDEKKSLELLGFLADMEAEKEGIKTLKQLKK